MSSLSLEPSNCDSFTVKEIKEYAKLHEISLNGLTRKADFCAEIRAHFSKSESTPMISSSKLFKYPEVSTTVFKGSVKYELLSLIYILRKHKDIICGYYPFYKSEQASISTTHSNYSITWNCDIESGLTFPYGFLRQLKACKRRFFFCPFTIKCQDSGQHANMIVYDLAEKTVEQFDPHGVTSEIYKINFKVLADEFKNQGFKYLPQLDLNLSSVYRAVVIQI